MSGELRRDGGRATPPAGASAGGPRRLVVVPWLEGGGGQAALIELLISLGEESRRLLDVLVVFDGSRDYAPVEAAAGTMTFLRCPRTPLGSLLAAVRLAPVVRGYPLVYSLMRASHAALGAGLFLVPPRSRPRFAASIHSLPSVDRRGPRGRLEDVFVRRLLSRAEIVTTPSARAKREIEEYYGVDAGRVVYEENLRTPDRRPVVARPEPGERPLRLLFAGRLSRQKGLDRSVGLLNAVEHPVELLIAGDGEELGRLRDDARGLAARHTIGFLGRRADIAELLDDVDAAFMPSRHELSPVFVRDAWARGRAVVCSDLPVFRDLAPAGPLLIFSTAAEFGEALAGLRSPGFLAGAAGAAAGAAAAAPTRSALHDFLAAGVPGNE